MDNFTYYGVIGIIDYGLVDLVYNMDSIIGISMLALYVYIYIHMMTYRVCCKGLYYPTYLG